MLVLLGFFGPKGQGHGAGATKWLKEGCALACPLVSVPACQGCKLFVGWIRVATPTRHPTTGSGAEGVDRFKPTRTLKFILTSGSPLRRSALQKSDLNPADI